MGMQTKAVGGSGDAGGFGQDTLAELGRLLGPSFGFFDDLLSPGGGRLGGARRDLLNREFDRSSNRLASQFGQFGNAFGTGAATAQTRLASERGPRLLEATGQLQLSGLAQLLPLIAGLAGRDIPQRQIVQQQGGIGQFLSLAAPIAGAAFGPGGLLAGSAFSQAIQPRSQGTPAAGIRPGSFSSQFDDQLSNLPNLNFLAA